MRFAGSAASPPGEAAHLIALPHDADFDRIAGVTGQRCETVVLAGSVDRTGAMFASSVVAAGVRFWPAAKVDTGGLRVLRTDLPSREASSFPGARGLSLRVLTVP